MDGDRAGDRPLDASDPRYGLPAGGPTSPRRGLVPSQGPGPSPESPRVRVLRIAITALFVVGLVVIAAVFVSGLRTGSGTEVLGPEPAVRAAVAERPLRVCVADGLPCAWVSVVDGELVALATSGPLSQEFGRQGVGWCPSSGWYGAHTTGSRFDQLGRVATGPAPRGLDRFELRRTGDGEIAIDFFSRRAAPRAGSGADLLAPEGPHCDEVPFGRDIDLELP